jgi:hypothetical protein
MSLSLLTKVFLPVLALGMLAGCGPSNPSDNGSSSSSADNSVMYENDAGLILDAPVPDSVVISPLTVIGRARGTWFFEASFPVKLLDADGNEIAVGIAQAQDDWMTENYVSFQATLTFTTQASNGTLVLQKDNPSGLPEHDAEVRVPVRFE